VAREHANFTARRAADLEPSSTHDRVSDPGARGHRSFPEATPAKHAAATTGR